jgi:hypothetical protein
MAKHEGYGHREPKHGGGEWFLHLLLKNERVILPCGEVGETLHLHVSLNKLINLIKKHPTREQEKKKERIEIQTKDHTQNAVL